MRKWTPAQGALSPRSPTSVDGREKFFRERAVRFATASGNRADIRAASAASNTRRGVGVDKLNVQAICLVGMLGDEQG